MSSPPCSITAAEEGYQTCVSASNQPKLHITHIYTSNPDASHSFPAGLSAAVMVQQQLQQQQQQQAKQKEGSTGVIRRSCRQRKRPRYFPPMKIPAVGRHRQKNAASPFALQDALAFIDSVKLAYLPTKPYVYNLFLATMREFRTGGATVKELMEMIIALFGTDGARGRKCVLGFSVFCPPGWGIRQGNEEGKWVLIMP